MAGKLLSYAENVKGDGTKDELEAGDERRSRSRVVILLPIEYDLAL